MLKRFVWLFCFYFCFVASAADPNPRELFERALAEQNQNLAEAVRLFGQVANLAAAGKPLAAEALYRQGLLYERLRKKAEAEDCHPQTLLRSMRGAWKVVTCDPERSWPVCSFSLLLYSTVSLR